jgi:tight adherence protein C
MDKLPHLLDRIDPDLILPAGLMLVALLVGAAAVWAVLAERSQLKQRAKAIGALDPGYAGGGMAGHAPTERERERGAALIRYVSENFVPSDKDLIAKLKRQLLQAGYLKPSAVAMFFLARGVAAVALGVGTAVGLMVLAPDFSGPKFNLAIGGSLVLGYLLPSMWLDRRIKALASEHRYGFPDFMDLMVVCADSGLAMESALERVGREMAATHPSLSANLTMATLEMRAGRTLGEALEHLGERLGIEEARSFATLLQQSEELGSSLTDALRVYSDDMRHQRLMRAEEKAYALPAKMVIPLGIFIFPVVMIVALLPVVIRVKFGLMGG